MSPPEKAARAPAHPSPSGTAVRARDLPGRAATMAGNTSLDQRSHRRRLATSRTASDRDGWPVQRVHRNVSPHAGHHCDERLNTNKPARKPNNAAGTLSSQTTTPSFRRRHTGSTSGRTPPSETVGKRGPKEFDPLQQQWRRYRRQ